jgi:hypothetical protein
MHRTLTAAVVAAVIAASPAHASPFDLVPAAATMLAAWSFTGSACGDGPLPGTYATFGDVPYGTIGCIDGADFAIFRGADGVAGVRFAAPFHSPVGAGIYLWSAAFLGGFPYGSHPDPVITRDFFDTDDNVSGYLANYAGKPVALTVVFTSAHWVDEDPSGLPYVSHTNAAADLLPVAIATPEPASLALVATGVLLVGAVARRRRA